MPRAVWHGDTLVPKDTVDYAGHRSHLRLPRRRVPAHIGGHLLRLLHAGF
jgi:hypothetical protein